jgi:hypothetical protein
MPFTPSTGAKGPEAQATRANSLAAQLAPVIAEIRASGRTSLREIAAALDKRRIPTPRRRGRWSAMQVSRVLSRLADGTLVDTLLRTDGQAARRGPGMTSVNSSAEVAG